MEHHHSHHHHEHKITASTKSLFLFCIIINLLFLVAEALIGIKADSVSLVSDAGHNLSDVFGIILAYIAFVLEQKGDKSSVRKSRWICLFNTLLLIIAVVIIIYESIEKIFGLGHTNGMYMIYTASVAIIINGLTAFLLMRSSDNMNVKAAYLHAATDALVSIGVVIAGIVIYFTKFVMIDPIIGLIISVIILVPTLKLFVQCVHYLKDND